MENDSLKEILSIIIKFSADEKTKKYCTERIVDIPGKKDKKSTVSKHAILAIIQELASIIKTLSDTFKITQEDMEDFEHIKKVIRRETKSSDDLLTNLDDINFE